MSDVIITVDKLSKRYKLGQIGATTLRESAERWWHGLRGRDPDMEMGEVGRVSHTEAQRTQSEEISRHNLQNGVTLISKELKPPMDAHAAAGSTTDGSDGGKFQSSENSVSLCDNSSSQVSESPSPLQVSGFPPEADQPVADRSQVSDSSYMWALKDVSFEVKRGEVLGIIGRNGAGKSTLLKILSRITEPTSGRAILRGRVGSLLEVGTGFHPELTGRENIFLNGAILGMKKREIDAKFDEIVAFSEVEKFIDTPVKRYSSGMYVRLAFAVAAHLDPEILVVDEVLAVGDAAFQKKCLGKMGDVAHEGRTVLFVSHNMGAVTKLCRNAIALQNGTMYKLGSAVSIVADYLARSTMFSSENTWSSEGLCGMASMRLINVELKDVSEKTRVAFGVEEDLFVWIRYEIKEPTRGVLFCLSVMNMLDEIAFVSTSQPVTETLRSEGQYLLRCCIPAHLLNATRYKLKLSACVPGVKDLLSSVDCLSFLVDGDCSQGYNSDKAWPGVLCPKLRWDVLEHTCLLV